MPAAQGHHMLLGTVPAWVSLRGGMYHTTALSDHRPHYEKKTAS